MEKRKGIGLLSLLLRYVLICGGLSAVFVGLWWGAITVSIKNGFVLPANTAERQAQQALVRLQEKGVFDKTLVPPLSDYALFASDGTLIETSLAGNSGGLEDAKHYALTGENGIFRYHAATKLDGKTCVLQYRFQMPYASETLRKILPEFQTLNTLSLILLILIVFIVVTRHYVRVFKRCIAPLEEAAKQMAAGDLESSFMTSGIREYDAVLSSMDHLRSTLKQSLLDQWNMEHSRAAQITALAHDLKTPLTVIDGNAQLLEESNLTREQQHCLNAILRNVQSAQNYVNALKQLSHPEGSVLNEKEGVDGNRFVDGVRKNAEEICHVCGVALDFGADSDIPSLYILVQEVQRAISNIIDNAVERTPENGTVRIICRWEEPYLTIAVEDEGPGFTDKSLKHATELFYTDNESRTLNGHVGIGLTFASSVARHHRGELTLGNTAKGHGWVCLKLLCSV
ncbi:sensor histidine kinase [Paenibacillus sp. DMB20]|uniref:sensor histidine kinase n=1 Tax=Paenibacillus sp. DMB20 TaxID=1642570 RepID=UPI000627CDC4|nr:HAMP domain-containing sensor histidine kinase [Paenibacillus sp. DMB20]KKO50932.1 hypothetical protein XI25_28250 [Paenibacillus sp. DMB20]